MCQSSWKLLLQPSLAPCLIPFIKWGKNFVYKVSQYLEFKAVFLKKKNLSKGRRNVEKFFPKCFNLKTNKKKPDKPISRHYHPRSPLFFLLPFFLFPEAEKDEGKREFSSLVTQLKN